MQIMLKIQIHSILKCRTVGIITGNFKSKESFLSLQNGLVLTNYISLTDPGIFGFSLLDWRSQCNLEPV